MTEPPKLPAYTHTHWEDVPANLKTRTQLSKLGLKPAKGQEPVARMKARARAATFYNLYDMNDAVKKRAMSDLQRAASEQALEAARAARTCVYCFDHYPKAELKNGYCSNCHIVYSSRINALAWARDILKNPAGVIVIDTETTGLDDDDEIVEIAATDLGGNVLYRSLVRSTRPVGFGAFEKNRITEEMLASAPTWPEIHLDVEWLLRSARRVLAYGAEFDMRMIEQTCKAWGLAPPELRIECIMEWYADYYGEWNGKYRRFRWQALNGDHTAMGDCVAAIDRLITMADSMADPADSQEGKDHP